MAVRDSDTSLWLHNKLGTSNDSWISGSICSQLNKEVLRNIKECFPDLQTQVKLKLLLSFFHIPRRLVEEWKTELEEVIDVAGLDSELWVSMLAETMKTFPATSSLNTEIADYEDTRPIFTDMVSDLRKLVAKHCDLGMLPLECQYLNKNALVSVVGQQQQPVKHFTLKRKPKSANLRTELLHKSADAQSSLKKASAPMIPLRSRGMPRKMTDTTPLKGIPSRVPTSGFRSSPNVGGSGAAGAAGSGAGGAAQRPNLSRTTAGRKDGGIKLIEFTEQPLGYAAAKKRKREQQLEEQQKKQEQKAAAAAGAVAGGNSPTSASPTAAAATAAGGTPTTPTSTNASFEIKTEATAAGGAVNLNQSLLEENAGEEKPLATPKAEPITPDYAPALSYSATTAVPAVLAVAAEASAGGGVSALAAADKQSVKLIVNAAATTTTTPTKVQSGGSSNNIGHVQKRIKQEIEIKSEEILVPATIKVEKIEQQPTSAATTTSLPSLPTLSTLVQSTSVQTQPPRLQQRVIIQQQQQLPHQQQQQHVLIRAAPQQQKQTTTLVGSGITLTSHKTGQVVSHASVVSAAASATTTPVKMEKLDIKPLVRTTTLASSAAAATNTLSPSSSSAATTTTIFTQQQLRQAAAANNPLANLPNNISVKITSTKAKTAAAASAAAGGQSHLQQQQQQQPILINSSTPVILSSSPTAQAIRQKQMMASTAATGTTTSTTQTIKSMPLSQLKTAANSGPVIISQTIIQPAKRNANAGAVHVQQQPQQPQQQQQQSTQYILTSSAPQQQQQLQQSNAMPTLTSFAQARPAQQTIYQTAASTSAAASGGGGAHTPTKILLKTSPTTGVMMTPVRQQQQQPPPLVAQQQQQQQHHQQPTLMSLHQNVQLPNRPVTIQPASQAAQQQHLQAQLHQHQTLPQQQQQQQQQHTVVSNTSATQQPKLTQVLMQSSGGGVINAAAAANVKSKTIILTQKGVILRNIGGDMYQQIPISNVSGLQNLAGGTTLMTTAGSGGPPSLVKTTASNMAQPQTIQLQQQHQLKQQQLPTLISTQQQQQQQQQQTHMIVQAQPQQHHQQQTIIRPLQMTNAQGGLTQLPQGLTLIQRPGQQPQLVQVQAGPAQQQQQQHQLTRTIITQPASGLQQQQLRPQQIVLQHKSSLPPQTQQRLITTAVTSAAGGGGGLIGQPQQIQIQQQSQQNPSISRAPATTHIQVQVQQQPQQQQQQAAPQRKGLSLSNEHVHKAHEMFRKANRVSRPDKALILGFMAGLRENPRPNSENVIVIKLGETEEKVQQEDGSTALCLVESLIRLDYNTGEWKTFQNYRRLDQSAPGQTADGNSGGSSNVMQAQNSVVI